MRTILWVVVLVGIGVVLSNKIRGFIPQIPVL